MKTSDLFQPIYMKKEDVPVPARLTILDVSDAYMPDSDGDKKRKAVLNFKEAGRRPMIVNKTNWLYLVEEFGDESDNWKGKIVEVYVDTNVTYAGRRVGGLKVRVPTDAPRSY